MIFTKYAIYYLHYLLSTLFTIYTIYYLHFYLSMVYTVSTIYDIWDLHNSLLTSRLYTIHAYRRSFVSTIYDIYYQQYLLYTLLYTLFTYYTSYYIHNLLSTVLYDIYMYYLRFTKSTIYVFFISTLFTINNICYLWYLLSAVSTFYYRYMTRKLFDFAKGKCAAENMDSPMFQEVLMVGHLYQMALRVSVRLCL